MYKTTDITGASLPPKTLCLTFDDGPGQRILPARGPRTLELARYLARPEISVPATFFVTGQHAELYPDLLPRIQSYGHLIANHTYSHPDMPLHLEAGGDPGHEILQTDRLIHRYVTGATTFVRPPYLEWNAAVANTLNGNLLAALNHVGPIGSDIFLDDYAYWGDGRPYTACLEVFYEAILRIGKGIVLLHDSTADNETTRQNNQTYELIVRLVPRLLAEGFRFIRLDTIPAVVEAITNPLVCGLKGSNGKYMSAAHGGGGAVLVEGPRFDAWERITVEYVSPGEVALRASNGSFLSAQAGGGREVLADGPRIDAWERFDVIPVGASKVAFRTVHGKYLTRENAEGGRLMANVDRLREWEVFSFENYSL